MKELLHAKRTSFLRFISEGLVMDKVSQVVEVVPNNWRREAPLVPFWRVSLHLGGTQDELALYHFLHADEIFEVANITTDEPDLFSRS